LSVTVDPDYDTPPVLTEYAAKNGADKDRWVFLTGLKPEVRRFIQSGLRLAVEDLPPGETSPEGPIIHSTKFILIDAATRIRGYYDGLDPNSLAQLAREARLFASK
jgi:protein SCO1/2